MNKQELIKKFEERRTIIGNFQGCGVYWEDIKEIFEQLDEPQAGHADEAPRRVKNILARLRELPLHDREVWLKAIMSEFEQDFSHAKWREGYEQGKFEGALEADKKRVVVPQYIADFITEQKKRGLTLSYSIDASMSDGVAEWYWDNPELFARAWLDGYEVEKEKRYLVKMKNVSPECECLYWGMLSKTWLFKVEDIYGEFRKHHTRKELEEAGFGWVFDCEGIEVEEV